MMRYLNIFFSVLFAWVLLPAKTFAEYVPLTKGGIPQANDLQKMTIVKMLNTFFTISVSIAAVLAVIMITIGGFKYMTTESIFKSSGAKEQIMNAIIGLLIVLTAILVLFVINPDIVSLRLFN